MNTEKHQCIDHYIADLCEQLHKAFKEVQVQSSSEAERQQWFYDCMANNISLEPGNLVLVKAKKREPTMEGKRWKTSGRN